jgi:hypothetical protein
MYNYLESMKEDIKRYLEDGFDVYSDLDPEELEQQLNDDLWICDSVTGNASGSYTFCRETAKEYVSENMGECAEALKEFCVEAETIAEKFLNEDWEYFDVTIRCYLLGQAISETLEEVM